MRWKYCNKKPERSWPVAKVPVFSCRCRLSEVATRARLVAEARAVRRTDVACSLGLAALLVLTAFIR